MRVRGGLLLKRSRKTILTTRPAADAAATPSFPHSRGPRTRWESSRTAALRPGPPPAIVGDGSGACAVENQVDQAGDQGVLQRFAGEQYPGEEGTRDGLDQQVGVGSGG